jgi:acetolactate synthase-1/2/3 large subunit
MDHFFDAIYNAGDAIQCIHSRHEQGAAYMAFGYARSTGRTGVYTVVPGPGVLNTTAALCTAYACNSPVLCLTGQIPSEGIGSGRGYLHEIPDQLATLSTLTKWSSRIARPDDAPLAVASALQVMHSGRKGPVSLEMAMDVMAAKSNVNLIDPIAVSHPAPSPKAIEQAARTISKAARPLIVVGGGAIGARENVRKLAELLQAPVTAFRSGRGILSDRHPLSATYPVGYELWKSADLIIAIGTRLMDQSLSWGFAPDMKLVRIDIDPAEFERAHRADVAVEADAEQALRALLPLLEDRIDQRPSRTAEVAAARAVVDADIRQNLAPQLSYLRVLRDFLPDDGILVDEITQVGYSSWFAFPVYAPRTLITCGYQGTLGYGLATALGVKVANPDKKVVSISGDGGFMFNVQELATAAQYNIELTIVVFNNNLYENVRRQQREWFDGRYIASELKNPDFVALAKSFGIPASRADSPQTLAAALDRARHTRGPRLIEVAVGEMPTPWRYIIRPRARGGQQ